MSQSYYSVYGTPLHLLLDDEFAANYNAAQRAFFEAQVKFNETSKTTWAGEPLNINWTEEHRRVYNQFAELMNSMIDMAGGALELGEEEMTSDFLVKL